MTFDQAVKHFGSRKALQEALGVTKGATSQWSRDGLPEGRQYQLEILTDGELKADRQDAA